jgi:hypothetical protein
VEDTGGVSGTEEEAEKGGKGGKSSGMLFSGILTVWESVGRLGSCILMGMPTLESVFELTRLPISGRLDGTGFGVEVASEGKRLFKIFCCSLCEGPGVRRSELIRSRNAVMSVCLGGPGSSDMLLPKASDKNLSISRFMS